MTIIVLEKQTKIIIMPGETFSYVTLFQAILDLQEDVEYD